MNSSDLIAIPELFLLLTAYLITTQRDVPQVIKTYKLQSYVLASIGVLIALLEQTKRPGNITETLLAIFMIALLPFALAISIEWVLARATVYQPGMQAKHSFWKLTPEQRQLAKTIWLEQRQTISPRSSIFFLFLTMVAFVMVFLGGINVEIEQKIGISVSLALHLIGLYNTFLRQDILSQVTGILTMDQGMYLAILKVVNIPVPATLFVIALYFYTIITIIILFVVLPQLRHEINTLSLDNIAKQSNLRG